MVFMP